MQETSEISVNAIVLATLQSTFSKGRRPKGNVAWLKRFLAVPRCRAVAVDEDTAERYALIHDYLRRQGTPVSPNDLWIAASVAQHGLRVLTLDGDFERIPQVIVEKFEPPQASRP